MKRLAAFLERRSPTRRRAAQSLRRTAPSSAMTGIAWLSTEISRPIGPQIVSRRNDCVPVRTAETTGQSSSAIRLLFILHIEKAR